MNKCQIYLEGNENWTKVQYWLQKNLKFIIKTLNFCQKGKEELIELIELIYIFNSILIIFFL